MKKLLKEYALRFVGLPYKWGGDDTIEGFDCSGFIQELLAAFGKDPEGDQTAQALYDYFKERGDEKEKVNLGDLVFYGDYYYKQETPIIKHVAMGIGSGLIIEAGGGNSMTKTSEDAARQNAYIRIRPVDYRPGRISIIDPLW